MRKGADAMRHFSRDEWYFDGVTWCGTDRDGKQYYPISYGDHGMAYGMTPDIQRCLNHHTITRVKEQLNASLRHDPFFFHHYVKIELVRIKEYPTFYFDYHEIAKKLRIKIDHRWSNEEVERHLTKYGFEPLADNPKIIEVSRDGGEMYREVLDAYNRRANRLRKMYVADSCFDKATYLLRSAQDLELLAQNVGGCNELTARYDSEINGFSYYPEDICFPCFVTIDANDAMAYSIKEVEYIANSAKTMLELVQNK